MIQFSCQAAVCVQGCTKPSAPPLELQVEPSQSPGVSMSAETSGQVWLTMLQIVGIQGNITLSIHEIK